MTSSCRQALSLTLDWAHSGQSVLVVHVQPAECKDLIGNDYLHSQILTADSLHVHSWGCCLCDTQASKGRVLSCAGNVAQPYIVVDCFAPVQLGEQVCLMLTIHR